MLQYIKYDQGTMGFMPKISKPHSKESQGWETPAQKNSRFSGNFCFYKIELPIFKYFAHFCVMLDNFLVSMVISYSRSKMMGFRFYQVLNVVWSENSELGLWLCVLLVFGKMVYLCKMIVDLKGTIYRKSSYSGN